MMRRLVTSIREKGYRQTLQSLFAKVEDRWFDFRYHTDTTERAPLEKMAINSENVRAGHRYQATTAGEFRIALSRMQFPPDSVFVDLGSGKGKVLMMAAGYGFKRVIGVEFSPEFCAIARRNVVNFKRRALPNVCIEVVECDVARYEVQEDENVFFLYNPFDGEVLKVMLDNIRKSVARHPRDVWIIYVNPVYAHLIDQKRYVCEAKYRYAGNKIIVFVGRASSPLEQSS